MDSANSDLDGLTSAELTHALQAVLEELAEVEEMRLAVLGQTGIHIGVVRLNQYNARFDRDRERLEARLQQIRLRLKGREAEQ